MKNSSIVQFLILILLASACLEEELPVQPIPPGEVKTVQIEIGYPYQYQVYYNCKNDSILSMNSRFDWELAFECSPEGYRVRCNTARGIFLARVEGDFRDSIGTENLKWTWDKPNGELDSTAIGDWRKSDQYFVLDLQYSLTGFHFPYQKLRILDVTEEYYDIEFSLLDGTDYHRYRVEKDPQRNFIHFGFEDGGQTLAIEPEKDQWDLLFSNHYHEFDNLAFPFVLTQVLINKESGVRAAESMEGNFEELTRADTANYVFTDEWDEIGYDWKIRNSQDNSFAIDPDKCFIIKDTEGYFFKLRFIDFYNDQGKKGYPKFEIQLL